MITKTTAEIVAEAKRWGMLADPADLHALIASWRERGDALLKLEAENFALAANQCHDGYGDEWGNHCCRSIDKAITECEFLARRAGEAEAQNARLREALERLGEL